MFYLGLVLFFGTHGLLLWPPLKRRIQSTIPEAAYMGGYSGFSLAGLVLMVLGYDSSFEISVPQVPSMYSAAPSVMFVAFWMLVAANLPSWTKSVVRHPMTVGIVFWAALHLSVNSNLHAWLLFGLFAVLVLLSALTAAQRGKARADQTPKLRFDAVALLIAGGLTALTMHYHGAWFGVAIL